MDQPILCMAVLFFLGWVIYLKLQIGGLKKQNAKLADTVRRQAHMLGGDAEVAKNAEVWGHRPSGSK